MLVLGGWCVIGQALEWTVLAESWNDLEPAFAAMPVCCGPVYGERTRRFGGLLGRSEIMERLVMHPLVLGIAEQVLLPWCERIALNLTQAIEIHPGALPQMPHRDQDIDRTSVR